jgi:hypothetical protein
MTNNKNHSQNESPVSREGRKSKLPIILGCLATLALLFLIAILGGLFYMTTSSSGQSVVFIRAPQEGDRLEAGQPVQVRALARDDHKITRIELWVDGELLDVQRSNTQSGINPFPLLTTWYPQTGAHTLIVRAFNSRDAASQASIDVDASALADQDLDGIADDADTCPDQPGSLAAAGCPDRDFDGIADSLDACPDEAGLPESGCPAPSEGDRDGDGFLDDADACPDEVGSPLAYGCPDADGDGVGDAADACPAEPGAGADGCPEADGGALPDPAPGGEPPPEPLPGVEPPEASDDDEPEPGSGFGDFFPRFDIVSIVQLEIEAYSLIIRNPYERVWCYVQLGNEDPRRYEFDTLGDQLWDIAEELGGENSVRFLHPENEPLSVSLNCLGSNAGEVPEELDEISNIHPPQTWDGRQTANLPDNIGVRYRVCSPSCDEAALPIPILAPVTTGPIGNGPYLLRWRWDGNESEIDGFLIAYITNTQEAARIMPLNLNADMAVIINDPAARSLDIEDYMPACGETAHFSVYAISPDRVSSPYSNIVSWSAEPCTYTANVTFTRLDVHNPPADEDSLHRPGPIYGEFWVSNGTTIERLGFDACWCYFGPGASIWGWCEGLELQSGQYSIERDIFGWIDRAKASCLGDGCHSNSFYAPFSASLSIPLEDGDDLTVGGRIMDCDAKNANDVVFEQQGGIRIDVDELEYLTVPIPLGLNGDHINLDLFIRMGR